MNISSMASPATHIPNIMTSGAQDIGNLTEAIHLTNSPLMSLPREIRDKIYAYLLRAGDLAILRTSKQLSREAKERLYREGFWRWKLNRGRRDPFHGPQWSRIENCDVRVYFGLANPLDCGYIFRFLANYTRANECYVTIEYDAFNPRCAERLWQTFLSTLAAGIACLTTFEKVVVGLVPVDAKCLPRDMLVDHGERAEIWGVLKEKLEPDLGPWKVIGGTDGVDGLDGELVFHPVEFRSSPVHENCIFETKLGFTKRSDDLWLALQPVREMCLNWGRE